MIECKQAIILAAGRGSRMKNHTANKPKCMVEIGGKPLLSWQMEALQLGGVEKIIIITGYCAEAFNQIHCSRVHNDKWQTTNMVSSLLCASEFFKEPTIISYSDIIYSSDCVTQLQSCDMDINIVYDKNWLKLWNMRFDNPLDDAETFKIDHNSRIMEIGQKAADTSQIQGQYTGLMKFSPKGFKWVLDWSLHCNDDLASYDMTMMLQDLIVAGYPVTGYPVIGSWCEVDSSKDLKVAEILFKD